MRNMTLFLSLLSLLLPALGCGGSRARTHVAADRVGEVRDERYLVVVERENQVEQARLAVNEAEEAVRAAEEAERVLTSHSPAAVEAACEILASTPAQASVEEVAEVEEIIEEHDDGH